MTCKKTQVEKERDDLDLFAAAALTALLGESLRAADNGTWRPKTPAEIDRVADNAFVMAERMLDARQRAQTRRGL